jgi:hypothetical protein
VELYLHSPIYLHGIVLNKLSTGTILPRFCKLIFCDGFEYWARTYRACVVITDLVTQFLFLRNHIDRVGDIGVCLRIILILDLIF